MKFATLIAPLALAAQALADAKAIVDALATIDATTVKLGAAVNKWNGDLFGSLPIVSESTTLLVQTKKGTKAAEGSEALDFYGTLDVAKATNNLVKSVNATMTALIGAKPKFDKLKMSPIIFLTLEIQQGATTDMSNAIIAKVPVQLQDLAKDIVKPIDESFKKAIDVYNILGDIGGIIDGIGGGF